MARRVYLLTAVGIICLLVVAQAAYSNNKYTTDDDDNDDDGTDDGGDDDTGKLTTQYTDTTTTTGGDSGTYQTGTSHTGHHHNHKHDGHAHSTHSHSGHSHSSYTTRNGGGGGGGDWRRISCKTKSKSGSINTACLACTEKLGKDNQDFACYDWCAAYAQSVDDMKICVDCLVKGYNDKTHNPWACGQCNQYAYGDYDRHSGCVSCLESGVNDYYCTKALQTEDDNTQLSQRYQCLAAAYNDNQKLESCINDDLYRRLRLRSA